MKKLNSLKIFILFTVIFLGWQNAFAGDFAQTVESLDYTDAFDIDSTYGIPGASGMKIFEDDRTKVIHTKGKSLRAIFSRGRKKNKNNEESSVFEPEVIDYDYDTDKEEIIPIYKDENIEEAHFDKKTEDAKEAKDKKIKKDKNEKSAAVDSFSKSDINIYCDDMEYFDDRKEVVGTGNAKVVFVANDSVMTADKIVYNHDLNYVEGIDNVRMTRNGNVLEGDYTKVDLNYGNAMMDNPMIEDHLVKVYAKSGNVTSDTLEAYEGLAKANRDMEMRLYSAQYAGFFNMEVNQNMYRKFYPKEYRYRGTKYHIKTKELYVNSTKGHDVIKFKNADIYYGKVLMLKGADLSLSTDKNQSFVETTIPELGSMRYVGSYFGPGFVFNTPFSSTLKVVPMITHDSGKFGIGIMGRIRHKRNTTQLIYSTAASEFVARGRQQLGDSDFFLEYAHMAYMNDWFLGANISKYLIQAAYQKRFIYPELGMSISHRATAGYLTDLDGENGTARFRYQAMFTKNLLQYINYDRKLYASLDLVSQGMMGVYGTGDSVGVFRIGPSIRTQYRGWGQRITYYQTAKGGESPLKYTDDYRYGNGAIQLIENLRINKYLAIGLYTVLNLQNNDITRDNMFSEARFMVSFGPEDAKISLGYDTVRKATMFNYTALIGSKNQDIAFKKLFMKNPDKLGKEEPKKERWYNKIFHPIVAQPGEIVDGFSEEEQEIPENYYTTSDDT